MIQLSRTMSLIEATTNVAAGLVLSVLLQWLLFPAVGIAISLTQNLALACAFTALSLMRGYAIRRLFARWG